MIGTGVCVGVGPGVREGCAVGITITCRVCVAVGTAVSVATIVGVGMWLVTTANGVGVAGSLGWQAVSTAVPNPTINNIFA
ncbi:MAG: hypothetical protein H6657_21505 [Ardenticatenaceae bacterium]|nr:hypothetical protein [Ardenticatenaceae bacterium]